MLFVPAVGVSINMISLFAIIVTIGIVVDDAVVVGENVFSMRQKGYSFMEASIRGARQMAVPVFFAILTNIAAFMPLLFVPGITGKVFRVIPLIVIFIFLVSLIEALFILPAHLSHKSKNESGGIVGWLNRRREWFPKVIVWLRNKTYEPTLRFALRWRYVVIAFAVVLLLLALGLVGSGRIEFAFLPKIESERISVVATLPFGSPVERTRDVQDQLISSAQEIIAENGGDDIVRGLYSELGSASTGGGGINIGSPLGGGHVTNVQIYLVPMDDRDITAAEFVRQWNRRNENLVGLESLVFNYSSGPSSGKPISFLISHPDIQTLESAAAELADGLKGYTGVVDIDDGFSGGKEQLDFEMKPTAQSLGINALDLARQVRGAFFGAEALRNQRGRDEVRVYVRLPEDERQSVYNIEELMIRAPNGAEIPLKEAARVKRGRSYTEINRVDGKRVLNVTADVEPGLANANKVIAQVTENELAALQEKYEGLNYLLDGEQRDQREAMQSLGFGFVLAMFGIFTLLAIPFKSYFQPFIIMTSIPFGIVGAVLGHIVMGYELSIISMFGIIALAGVVVNAGLILIDRANRVHWAGDTPFNAAVEAGKARFRPILLTSVTTFIGLAPMIFETSLQARFLIPMAISLGFGILFSTGISLILIPCLYMVVFDVKALLGMPERNDDQVREMKMMAEREGVSVEDYLSDDADGEAVA
jgi:multidrug efflux pump subunit AcrB